MRGGLDWTSWGVEVAAEGLRLDPKTGPERYIWDVSVLGWGDLGGVMESARGLRLTGAG